MLQLRALVLLSLGLSFFAEASTLKEVVHCKLTSAFVHDDNTGTNPFSYSPNAKGEKDLLPLSQKEDDGELVLSVQLTDKLWTSVRIIDRPDQTASRYWIALAVGGPNGDQEPSDWNATTAETDLFFNQIPSSPKAPLVLRPSFMMNKIFYYSEFECYLK